MKRAIRLEFDPAQRRIVVNTESGELRLELSSAQRRGLFALLVDARLSRRRDGWVSAAEIARHAPGWEGHDQQSVGKRMHDLLNHELIRQLVTCTSGSTVGPWRIAVSPELIVVTDPGALSLLLSEARSLRLHIVQHVVPSADVLDGLDGLVRSGIVGAPIATVLEQFLGASDDALRAKATRIEAQRLRLQGQLSRAKWLAAEAVAFFDSAGASFAAELAASRHELGATDYHSGLYDEALEELGLELAALQKVEDRIVRARGIARYARFALFTLMRLDDLLGASAAAIEAETYAAESGDATEQAFARLAALRVEVYDGHARQVLGKLRRAAADAPIDQPLVQLQAHRFLAECHFALENWDDGDVHAIQAFLAARNLELAREADAAAALLRNRDRRQALARLRIERIIRRDRLNDAEMAALATLRTRKAG